MNKLNGRNRQNSNYNHSNNRYNQNYDKHNSNSPMPEKRNFRDDADGYQAAYSKGYEHGYSDRDNENESIEDRTIHYGYDDYDNDGEMKKDNNNYRNRYQDVERANNGYNHSNEYEDRGRGKSDRFSEDDDRQAFARRGDYNNERLPFHRDNSGHQQERIFRNNNTKGLYGNRYNDENKKNTSQDGIYDMDKYEKQSDREAMRWQNKYRHQNEKKPPAVLRFVLT